MNLKEDIKRLLNEVVKNPILVKYYADLIVKEVLKVVPTANCEYPMEPSFSGISAKEMFRIKISKLKESEVPLIKKILNKWDQKLKNEDFLISFGENNVNPYTTKSNKDNVEMEVFFKTKYVRRVKPERFVYHFSRVSDDIKNDIIKNGLKPVSHKFGNFSKKAFLGYPDAIFAKNGLSTPWLSSDWVFQIDTLGLKNIWWEDLNFEAGTTDYIMTYEPIPAKNIKVITYKEYMESYQKFLSDYYKQEYSIE